MKSMPIGHHGIKGPGARLGALAALALGLLLLPASGSAAVGPERTWAERFGPIFSVLRQHRSVRGDVRSCVVLPIVPGLVSRPIAAKYA